MATDKRSQRTSSKDAQLTAARRARRERRRERSREEILDAARHVLMRKGIAGTTVEAVARELGMTKTALYYYFPSKDAMLFELIYAVLDANAHRVHDAVDKSDGGADALRAIIAGTITDFVTHLDDFRLAYLHGQVAGQGAVKIDNEQFTRIRPLNDLWYAGAAEKLAEGKTRGGKRAGRAKIEPRLLAFLAHVAAIGVLTVKGMVESVDDPLAYSDKQLIEGMVRVFEAAAGN